MTVDERLDQVELLAAAVAKSQKEHDRRFAEIDRRMAQVLDAITRLTNIVESHEDGIERIEEQ